MYNWEKDDLERFVKAQKQDYDIALKEIRAGRKKSHWIWYVFPQIAGLGFSSLSQYYAISSMEEAKGYMKNTYLREHLLEISEELLALDSDNPEKIMGYPDNLKLRSSMTLFAEAMPEEPVFQAVLDKYFEGKKVYLDITQASMCISVCVNGAEVVLAGTSVNSMSVCHKNREYQRFSEEYDIHFIFDGKVPKVDFYTIPMEGIL